VNIKIRLDWIHKLMDWIWSPKMDRVQLYMIQTNEMIMFFIEKTDTYHFVSRTL